MSIGGVLGGSNVIIVFNSIGILIPQHFSSHRLDFFVPNKARNIHYPYVTEFISQNQLTFNCFSFLLDLIR
jgi:hypothetical protein